MFSLTERPRKLSQIRGQKYIVKEFKKRFHKDSNGNFDIPQVMLFSGSSGVGKSSISLIIASTLNCTNPILNSEGYYDPCLQCQSCKDVIEERFNGDVIQIDCTQSGKDDIVDIEKIVSISPMFSKNKVIIVEEFGTLASGKAKEAVLKLIEKPRKNTYFIFTSMTKLDKSVESRCSCNYLKPLQREEVQDYLFDILLEKKIEVPQTFISEVIPAIVYTYGDSVRESVSKFESAIMKECWMEENLFEAMSILSENSIDNVLYGLLDRKETALIDYKSLPDKKEFFSITRSLIVNACIYKINKDSLNNDKNYMIQKYIKISKNDNLFDLLVAYENGESGYYFSETKFMMELVKYYLNKKATPMLTRQSKK